MAGTVGAIFNGALQLGSAVGIAAVSSIEQSIEARSGNPDGYAGRAAAFWFLLGIIGLEIISLLTFYRVEERRRAPRDDVEATSAPASEKGKTAGDGLTPIATCVLDAGEEKGFSEKAEEVREEVRPEDEDEDSRRQSEDIREEPLKQE